MNYSSNPKNIKNIFDGKYITISPKLTTKRAQLQKLIKKHGGKYAAYPSKQTAYFIVTPKEYEKEIQQVFFCKKHKIPMKSLSFLYSSVKLGKIDLDSKHNIEVVVEQSKRKLEEIEKPNKKRKITFPKDVFKIFDAKIKFKIFEFLEFKNFIKYSSMNKELYHLLKSYKDYEKRFLNEFGNEIVNKKLMKLWRESNPRLFNQNGLEMWSSGFISTHQPSIPPSFDWKLACQYRSIANIMGEKLSKYYFTTRERHDFNPFFLSFPEPIAMINQETLQKGLCVTNKNFIIKKSAKEFERMNHASGYDTPAIVFKTFRNYASKINLKFFDEWVLNDSQSRQPWMLIGMEEKGRFIVGVCSIKIN